MLVLADTLPTPLESSTSPRGLLMPSLRLMPMPTTLAMVDTVLAMAVSMVDTDTEPMEPTPMPMEPTTERGLLMLSPRLMPTMVLMDMDMLLPTPMVPMPMVATPMPTDGASKMSSTSHQSRPPSTNAEAQ